MEFKAQNELDQNLQYHKYIQKHFQAVSDGDTLIIQTAFLGAKNQSFNSRENLRYSIRKMVVQTILQNRYFISLKYNLKTPGRNEVPQVIYAALVECCQKEYLTRTKK